MNTKVKEVVDLINQFAPNNLSYSWDNTGLLVGELSQPANRILITLDVTENIIDYAVDNNFDMIVSHHPMIFRPLKKINDPKIIKLIKNSIAVLAAHTNLDLVNNGVNHVLAELLELNNVKFVQKSIDKEFYHIIVYVPEVHLEKLKEAIFNAGGGLFGNYQQCSTHYQVNSQFLPNEFAKPVFGKSNQLEKMNEVKLEFFADSVKLKGIINAIHETHPYEAPTYAINKLNQDSPNFGLGLIGDLNKMMSLNELAEYVKEKLGAPFVKLWTAGKDANVKVSRIAICGGSGSSLLPLISNADCYISGDFTYHQIIDSCTPIIDAGHYYTEAPVLNKIFEVLSTLPSYLEIVKTEDHDIQNLKLI
ncbi:MAG TPA: Nif3-like dinuclear metal center hexameric protein [Candidatus Cloacimonadota bacterium]|nr:Nif3-like dinuclear metal center hexameric protein [Candidatus Cloacimonadota bacterium]HPK40912.1 Nif3-like dinuclear metal center hexameric protein [Candidatus Cloacimonadota bacterium]HPY97127.1 Nif3-like dinuclear metal center hexameric protein [Candidatus Cloacimonadota bacterium]